MIKKAIPILALLCTMALGAWAQTEVSTEEALKEAVGKGGIVKMAVSIDLSSPLIIPEGKTVTLDINDRWLTRKLVQAEDNGNVIRVEKGATLTITDKSGGYGGHISGGWARQGGGIYNEGTLNIERGSISDNKATSQGGGIWSSGTLNITGGDVAGNEAPSTGGIYNAGTMTMTDGRVVYNKSTTWGGGGIANHNVMTITNSTVNDNDTPSDGGGIWNKGTLTMNNVYVETNTARDAAGIWNEGTIDMTGCKINKNVTNVAGAGGIANQSNATLTIDGCTVTGNTGQLDGCGIWSAGTLNMKGEVYVWGNHDSKGADNNVFLDGEAVINLTGALVNNSDQACIGVGIPQNHRFITKGYRANHPGADANTFFRNDKDKYLTILDPDEDELQLANDIAPVTFTEYSWDDANKKLIKKRRTKYAIALRGQDEEWVTLGEKGKTTWYRIYDGLVSHKVFNIFGDVHIVLIGDPSVYLKHIKLEAKNDAKLHIYNEWGGTRGSINVVNYYEELGSQPGPGLKWPIYVYRHYDDAAAIGGGGGENMGSLFVHGGTISAAIQDKSPAAIGGGKNGSIDKNHQIVIYDGEVYAECVYKTDNNGYTYLKEKETYGAAIGGSDDNPQGGPITVYGGLLHSKTRGRGAGIGGGEDSYGGTVKIYGGKIWAEKTGKTIIDSSLEKGGSGIGGGYEGSGGDVHIYGGTIEATGGKKSCAIGGYEGHGKGTIEFAPNMKVTAGDYDYDNRKANPERVFTTGEREDACKYRHWAKVEACDHSAQNGDALLPIETGDEFRHSRACRYCADRFQEVHQLPGWSSDVCGVCERNISSICYYLYNDQDNEYNIATMAEGTKEDDHTWNVMLKDRTFYHDGNWNTLCLPFELKSFEGTPLQGATVERIKSASVGNDGVLTINLEEIHSLDDSENTVGLPLFVKWPKGEDEVNPRFYGVRMLGSKRSYWFKDGVAGTFQPLYAPLDITADNIDKVVFLGADNTLGYSKAPRQLHAMRGYFHIDMVAGVRAMTRAVINHNDGTTEVVSLKAESPAMADGPWYDLQGRRLDGEPTRKGIYIHNGKKVMK